MTLRAFVYPRHPETIILWDDLYAHLHFGFAFMLGLGLAKMDGIWPRFVAWRHFAAAGALIIALFSPRLGFHLANGTPVGLETHILRSTYAWLVIAALFGYAHHHIHKGSETLTLLTRAVFPFYILHQTAIILTAFAIKRLGLPVAVEAAVIILSTGLTCWTGYWFANRTPVLRGLMGLK